MDRQSVLALPSKELTRGPKVLKLEDVSTRQLAYVLATSVPFIHPSDLLQIGGEAAPRYEHIFHADFFESRGECLNITVKTRTRLSVASFVRPPSCFECFAD